MKILIISDTHGSDECFRKVYKDECKDAPVDLVIHAGDIHNSARDYSRFLGLTAFVCVSGNCDHDADLVDQRVIPLPGHKIFLVHGHRHHVQLTLALLSQEAALCGADIAVFGHTHRPEITEEGGVLCINPGSLSLPRTSDGLPSYAVLQLEDGKRPFCEIKKIS